MSTELKFRKSLAVMIGIDSYHAVHPLQSATHDVTAVGRLLQRQHGYEVIYCMNDSATLAGIRALLASLPDLVEEMDRVVFYFAGHGIAEEIAASTDPTGGTIDEGPQGYFVPQDARPNDGTSLLPMHELYKGLGVLRCRHLLLILDCCFAGAFRWSGHRSLLNLRPRRLYRERFERYFRETAWQVLTSAAHDERALDVFDGRVLGARHGSMRTHSPFAESLLAGLEGAADQDGDGVLLATELYCYIENHFARLEQRAGRPLQRPCLSSLRLRDRSEYYFLNPERPLKLESAVELNAQNNPYRGLRAYGSSKDDQDCFFGRDELIEQLCERVRGSGFIAVLGASGVGKSSLVSAGLLPRLRQETAPQWRFIGPIRPGSSPLASLRLALSIAAAGPDWRPSSLDGPMPSEPQFHVRALEQELHAYCDEEEGSTVLLIIDQLEEIVTLCHNEDERGLFVRMIAASVHARRLRVLVTIRSDFEPQFVADELQALWVAGRFVVPQPDREDLRKIIEGPAELRVLHFEPHTLVERLIDAVHQMPGALPLLSFTLSELYIKRLERAANDRTLTAADYDSLGGVIGALQHRIETIYRGLPDAAVAGASPTKKHMRRLLLRLVAIEGGERTRRRIPESELSFSDEQESTCYKALRQQLCEARLLVQGQDEGGSGGGEAFLEPAHDALVCGWSRLSDWLRDEQDTLPLERRLTQSAVEWARGQAPSWHSDPRLDLALPLSREPGRFNALEERFLAESDRQRKARRRWTITGLVGAFVGISAAAGVALYQRQEAVAQGTRAAKQEQRAIAEADRARAEEGRAKVAADLANKTAAERDTARSQAEKNAQDAIREANAARESQRRADEEARQARDLNRLRLAEAHWQGDPTTSAIYLSGIEQISEEWKKQAAKLAERPISTAVLRGHAGVLSDARFSPDGAWLITTGYDGTARLHRSSGNGPPLPVVKHPSRVVTAAFSRDGRYVATGAEDGSIGWIPLHAPDRAVVRKLHQGLVHTVVFSPDGKTLATVARDGKTQTTVARDGKTQTTEARDGTVRLWPVGMELGKPLDLKGHKGEIWSVAFTSSGEHLIGAGDDGFVHRWSTSTGMWLSALPGEPAAGGISHLTISQDARYVAAALFSGVLREWDLAGQLMAPREYAIGGAKSIDAVMFGPPPIGLSQPSPLLLALTPDGVRLERRDRERLSELVSSGRGANTGELSTDGRYLAVNSSSQGSAIPVVFSLSDNRLKTERYLIGHSDKISTIHFSPKAAPDGGVRIVTASEDGTARIWNLQTPTAYASPSKEPERLLTVLRGFTSVCLSVPQLLEILPNRSRAVDECIRCEQMHQRSADFCAKPGRDPSPGAPVTASR